MYVCMFIEHDKPERMYAQAGLDAEGIMKTVFQALGQDAAAGVRRA